jgi:hypothetical protein
MVKLKALGEKVYGPFANASLLFQTQNFSAVIASVNH